MSENKPEKPGFYVLAGSGWIGPYQTALSAPRGFGPVTEFRACDKCLSMHSGEGATCDECAKNILRGTP